MLLKLVAMRIARPSWGLIALTLAAAESAAAASIVTPLTTIAREGYPVPDIEWVALSPDGLKWARGETTSIRVLPWTADAPPVVVRGIGHSAWLMSGADAPESLRWEESGDSIWAATWSYEEGVRPARAALDGTLTPVPMPAVGAAPLDRLIYVNGRGLAIGLFAARQRGEGENEGPPTAALLDLPSGRVVSSFRLDQRFPTLGEPAELRKWLYLPSHSASVELPGGGVRFAANFDAYVAEPWLMLWDSRAQPRLVRTVHARALSRFALTPDGRRVLVAHRINFWCSSPPDTPCRDGRLGEGVSLALLDFDSGRVIWERRERDVFWLRVATPVISPDGRFAIVAMPDYGDPEERRANQDDRGRLAVVSLRDGRVLEEFDTAFGSMSLQLMADGTTLFVQAFSHSHLFRIDWQAARRAERAGTS